MISCICIAQKYGEGLRSSVDSFLKQKYDGEHELIIFSTNPRVKLECELPNVRVIRALRPCVPCDAKNTAIEKLAKGDRIVMWNEDDYYLPNHLNNISSRFDGNDYIWLDKQFDLERGKIVRIGHGSEFTFAFTKKAWERAGKFQRGFLNERNFVGKITQVSKGEKVPMTPETVSFIRCGSDIEKRVIRAVSLPDEEKLVPASKRDFLALVMEFITGKSDNKICVVELGRNGDIINILPFLKLIHDSYTKPHVGIAREFLPLFDGISYATPVVLAEKEEDLGAAVEKAKRDWPIVIVGQIWGRGWTQPRHTEAYNMESWRNIGLLQRFNDKTLRPVFDKRDLERESVLISSVMKDKKPLLLVNLSSAKSSPCPACPALLPAIQERFGNEFNIVDLSLMRAERLYDFIGLFEESAALVCLDTSFLHLAAATNIPIVALTNEKPWAGTTVRMNCVEHIDYTDAVKDFERVHKAIELAVMIPNDAIGALDCRPKEIARVFHLVDKFEDADPKALERKMPAIRSMDELYGRGELIPLHAWPESYKRNAKDILGDKRQLPYLKDLFQRFLDVADKDDICIWGNDDTILNRRIAEYGKFHCSIYGACSFFRSEFRGTPPPSDTPPEQYGKLSHGKHIGRDAFAFTREWLVKHWDEIPDFILGAEGWDLCMAAIIRLGYGINTTKSNLGEQIFPAEPQNGYVGHAAHDSIWHTNQFKDSPSNEWNKKLFRKWAVNYLPELKFAENNTL